MENYDSKALKDVVDESKKQINLLAGVGLSDGIWKDQAIALHDAITRVLSYLGDNGFIQLSQSTYMQYMDLKAIEELVFEHANKYGESFAEVSGSLKNYLISLPGYNTDPKVRKKQENRTIQQHGFIVMELTRAKNERACNQNELLRAGVSYSEHALSRSWLSDTPDGLKNYKASEVPDFWPWSDEEWQPESPRQDLVRSAALIIAAIERMDQCQIKTEVG